MHASFSFCGTDIEDLGLNYAPEIENTYVSKPASAVAHYETFDGHNGGYYYGSWFEPKEFILRCYFEETNIEKGILRNIDTLFRVGNSGKLIFSRSPWCYYYATVTEPVEYNLRNYLNGLVTIHMKAMYPFARSDIYKNTRAEKYHDILMGSTAVFEKEEMLISGEYTNITERITFADPIVLANQGTERAALGIAIAGDVGAGVVISNLTTGQSCKIVAVKKNVTSNVNKEVIIDPISGKTMLVGSGTKQLAFMYHEHGFLELESSFPAKRNLYITTNGNNKITVSNIVKEDLVGKYVFAVNKWYKILSQPDVHTFVVSGNVQSGRTERTMVIPMNEITVDPVTTMDLTSLRFIYKPTYA